MTEIQMLALSPDFQITLSTNPFLFPEDLKQEIEEIWKEQCRLNSKLFNGTMFVCQEATPRAMRGFFVEYKVCLAQIVRPSLSQRLQLCTVGVRGITIAQDKVLFGRRASHVTQYPLCYELAPAGGIDATNAKEGLVDYRKQLFKEFEEETGIPLSQIKSLTPFAFIRKDNEHISDVCVRIDLKEMPSKEALKRGKECEYLELIWVPLHEAMDFIVHQQPNVVPNTFETLKFLKDEDGLKEMKSYYLAKRLECESPLSL